MNEMRPQMSTGFAPAGSRLGELQRAVASLESSPEARDGLYNAVAMLLADAALVGDEDTLSKAQRLLRRLYFRQLRAEEPSPRELEQRGRVLALIDVLEWVLRRVISPAEIARLEPSGYGRRFIEAIAGRPGMSNQELAAQLGTEATEISRVGRRLIDAGLVRKRKLGRWNHWELTPRGQRIVSILAASPPAQRDATRMRDLAERVVENADVRERFGTPTTWLPLAGRVLATLLASETPLSPTEIATRTGLSRRVVATTAGFLMSAGYVKQDGDEPSSDAPSLPDFTSRLVVTADYCALGIKVLPAYLVGVVTDITDLRADAARVERRALPDHDPETVVSEVAALVRNLTRNGDGAEIPRYVIGLGIEMGGHVDSRRGTSVYSPHLGWRNVPLAELVSKETGLPTVVENDVDALAVHEQLVGTATNCAYFAAVLLDQGIGCGLILDGQLMRGSSGMAGELGHVVMDPDGPPCWCGKNGCLEATASIRGILNSIAARRGTPPATIGEAADLAQRGDGAAIDAFSDAGDAMGRGLSILLNITNVERVLLSVPEPLDPASRSRASKLFNGALISAVRQHCFSTAADCALDIRHLRKGDEHGAHGAASTVVRQFVYRPLTWRPVPAARAGAEAGSNANGADGLPLAGTEHRAAEAMVELMDELLRGPEAARATVRA